MKGTLEERFWAKVRKAGPDECWEWLGRKWRGYGTIRAGGENGHRRIRAHRVAWELARGSIPEGLCVLHRCDNRGCCNDTHLFLGTLLENNVDRDAKERTARGERHGRTKLTWPEVRTIRTDYAKGGWTMGGLARKHGVSPKTMQKLLHGVTWKE